MTGEDAIQIIVDLINNPFLHPWEESLKALKMVTEALSAEPSGDLIRRSGDLIRRSDAIEAVCTEDCGITAERCEELTLGKHCKVYNALSALPSATPTERTGEWVGVVEYCKHLEKETGERYRPSGVENTIYCNQCWSEATKKSDYCPNCGAKMKGGTE